MDNLTQKEKNEIIDLVKSLEHFSDELILRCGPLMVVRNSSVLMQKAAGELTKFCLDGVHPIC